jgi:hypothetical protein
MTLSKTSFSARCYYYRQNRLGPLKWGGRHVLIKGDLVSWLLNSYHITCIARGQHVADPRLNPIDPLQGLEDGVCRWTVNGVSIVYIHRTPPLRVTSVERIGLQRIGLRNLLQGLFPDVVR